MEFNSLTGSIPPSFGQVQNLQLLALDANSLGTHSAGDLEFLSALTNCTDLQHPYVAGNRLGGQLPTSIANLSTKLITLSLGANLISGSIPHDIGNPRSLQILWLHQNMLTGQLPTSLGKLVELAELIVYSNRMSGEIPSSIGNITQLLKLSLFNNSFEGTIPPCLSNCSRLLYLYIGSNNLNGTIPQAILQIPTLDNVHMPNNSLTGSIPNVGRLQNFVQLSLRNNNLSGLLPQTLGKCLSLERLNLQGNSFEGAIPDIKGLVDVKRVDLSNNNLSGYIPGCFANFSSLEYLNLSINNLAGRVLTEGIFQNVTIFSVFGNKDLCGGITKLRLKPCIVQGPPMETKHSSLQKKAAIGVSIGVALLLLLFVASVCWLVKRKKKQTNSLTPYTFEVFHEKISYRDLQNATDGYAPKCVYGYLYKLYNALKCFNLRTV